MGDTRSLDYSTHGLLTDLQPLDLLEAQEWGQRKRTCM